MTRFTHSFGVLLVAASPTLAVAEEISSEHLAFFENKIRPVLVEHCYKCHSVDAKKLKGELLLDSRPGWQKGGESGQIIIPGKPQESLIISALRYDQFEMPPKAKLPAETIADFVEWIAMGAPDPRNESKTRDQKEDEVFDLKERKKWWSLQPVADVGVPDVQVKEWPRSDHDRFVLAELEKKGWKPAESASRTSWLRRVTYDLTGLPPTPEHLQEFLEDQSPDAFEKVVDRLLGSVHFGEQWARHWMDLVRYAETKAFEADYPMPNVFHYRDYLIRAFNRDVPYKQLLREAIAGDLLEPRLDPDTGNNESVIGPGYLYLTDGQHGPPDIHSDEARIFADMIDVIGKAFLSQTVACARCHDHKFDAITTKDYYSLYGLIASSRIDYANINAPSKQEAVRTKLRGQKMAIRHALADVLTQDLKAVPDDWKAARDGKPATPQQKRWAEALKKPSNNVMRALGSLLAASDEATLEASWGPLRDESGGAKTQPGAIGTLSRDSFGDWLPSGRSFEAAPRKAGDFIVAPNGDKVVRTFASGRPAAGHLSSRFAGSLRSPTFTIEGNTVSVRVKGQHARVNLYVRHYELIGRGPTTGGTTKVIKSDGWQEHRFNTKLWVGEKAYVEVQQNGEQMEFKFATKGHADGSYVVFDSATNNTPLPKLPGGSAAWMIAGPTPKTPETVREHLATQLQGLADAWRNDKLTIEQGDLLEGLFDAGVLDFNIGRSQALKKAVETFRATQREVPQPVYVRSLADGHGENEPVYIRGSHKNLSKDPNPRHFLDGLDGTPFKERGSGRMEWADALVAENNPLTARVAANRIWHHLFGRGIVASVDDFGHMGDKPSHPALLDFLTRDFVNDGWSVKGLVRKLVLSSTYRMSSRASADALRDDPDNVWLQRMPVRRLQAEAIRDTLLAVSGQLDGKLYGPSQGGDGGNRRSVYIQLKRRYMPEFLMTFDMPNSTETFGRRNITANPTQSLAMMNSGIVWKAADQWARKIVGAPAETFSTRVDLVHRQAYGRAATEREQEWARGFLADRNLDEQRGAKDMELWKQLCHTMLNRKELIYVY